MFKSQIKIIFFVFIVMILLTNCSNPTKQIDEGKNRLTFYSETTRFSNSLLINRLVSFNNDTSLFIYSTSFLNPEKYPDEILFKYKEYGLIGKYDQQDAFYSFKTVKNIRYHGRDSLDFTVDGFSVDINNGLVYQFKNDSIIKSGKIIWNDK